jgi:hypothetical protein
MSHPNHHVDRLAFGILALINTLDENQMNNIQKLYVESIEHRLTDMLGMPVIGRENRDRTLDILTKRF